MTLIAHNSVIDKKRCLDKDKESSKSALLFMTHSKKEGIYKHSGVGWAKCFHVWALFEKNFICLFISVQNVRFYLVEYGVFNSPRGSSYHDNMMKGISSVC